LTAKKKLAGAFGGLVALGATVALTAGTFSYFSDSATVQGGTVGFGALELSTAKSQFVPLQITGAKPGTTVYYGDDSQDPALCFENTGDMMGVLQLEIVPDAGNSWQFNSYVDVEFEGYDTYPASDYILHGANSLAEYQAAGRVNASQMKPTTAESDENKCAKMVVSIDKAAPNELQGATGGFTIQATLVQQEENGIYPAS